MRSRIKSFISQGSPLAVLATLLAAGAGGAGGCKIDDGGGTEAGGDTGAPTCACAAGEIFGDCVCQTGLNRRQCWSGDGACNSWCVEQTGLGSNNLNGMVCYDDPDSGGCSGWNPTAAVRLVGGVRKIDDVWLANLVNTPAPLYTCDDAILNDLSTGKFKVELANSGEFLYQLGLRNNDVPQSLNGMPLVSVYDGMDAFQALYNGGVTSYTLVVKRGTSNITLYYLID
jgi:hypothetical protein